MQVSLEDFQARVRNFAESPGLPDIEARSAALSEIDPFPAIPAALLHSGHAASYIVSAGMVEPFDVAGLSKPATYLVPLEGLVRYVDASGNEQKFHLTRTPQAGQTDARSSFVLEPNAICFVTLKPQFRLPAYIAARFNLQIRDVYRGLLVGTGPLVDPGFRGSLSIPVHNFTSNSYRIDADDGFVYFEFTKLSWVAGDAAIPSWVPNPIQEQPPFPTSKRTRRNLDDYLAQATGNSATPKNAVVSEVVRLSKLNEAVKRRNAFVTGAAYVAGLTILLAAAATVAAALQLSWSVQQFVQGATIETKQSLTNLESKLGDLQGRIQDVDAGRAAAIQNQQDALEVVRSELEQQRRTENEALRSEIQHLQSTIESIDQRTAQPAQ